MNIQDLLIRKAEEHGWTAVEGKSDDGFLTITFKQPAIGDYIGKSIVKEQMVGKQRVRYAETSIFFMRMVTIISIDGRPPIDIEERGVLGALE